MATRSTISILKKDNVITSIYCHNDGYLAGVGSILYEFYRDTKTLNSLIELGDMSFLEFNVKSSYFYHRDGNEDLKVTKYSSYKDFKSENFLDFNYIFKEEDEKWYLINKETREFDDLSDLLLNEKTVSNEIKSMINNERLYSKMNKELQNKSSLNNIKKI